MSNRKKALGFGLLSTRRLLQLSEEKEKNVVISLDGEVVEDVWLIICRVENSGNLPIKRADFDRNLIICFEEPVKIISVDIIKQFPSNLHAKLEEKTNSVELKPLLLNRNDKIDIQIIISAKTPIATADMRVVGIPDLSPLVAEKDERIALSFIATTMIIVAIIYPLVDTPRPHPIAMMILFILLAGVVYMNLHFRKKQAESKE